jgi:ppGpp synthetase/RelA/SpoT-type nucleotidyltranferase
VTLSKSQIDKLGERLRKMAQPTADDLHRLSEFVTAQDPIRVAAESAVRALTLHEGSPTSRLKTNVSIIEKLRRQRTSLSKMQDIVGVRLITSGNRTTQDALVKALCDRWPDHRVYDRRERPQQGYRAVHVVVHIDERPAELQVRTPLQHKWAEVFEKVADQWGRNIRYGEPPDRSIRPDDTIPY